MTTIFNLPQMLRNVRTGLLVAALSLLSGCTDFLKEDPKALVAPVNFYTSVDEATIALMGVYNYLQPQYDALGMAFVSEMTTDLLTTPTDEVTGDSWGFFNSFQYKSTEGFILNNYRAAYQLIGASNQLLASTQGKKLTGDPAKQLIVEGEARFLRALTYFNLVRWFGGVTLATEPLKDIASAYAGRASEEEVYQLILSDLNTAVKQMAEKSEGPGRANKLAALTLLGKVQLTRKDYAGALTTLKQVVGKRSLYANYGDNFRVVNENNTVESIFEVQYGIVPEHSQVVQFSCPPAVTGHGFVYGIFTLPNSFINSYDPADARKNVNGFVMWENKEFPDKKWRLRKYIDALLPGVQATDAGQINFPVLRYADVLLMLAEAQNEVDAAPGSEAYGYLNQVRKRAGVANLSGLTKEQFRDAVLDERAKEFVGEGHRFYDLKRTGMMERVLAPLGFRKGVNEVFPIPNVELDANKNLTQNPGY